MPKRLGSPTGTFLDGIAAGKNGSIWFTDNGRPEGGGNGPHTIDRVNLRR